MRFTKMHGTGNDYLFVDGFNDPLPQNPAAVARVVSDRHTGVGADGLILICPTNQADAQMRIYNADGSEAEMCGNGLRCVAKYLYDHRIIVKPHMRIETGAGILPLELRTCDDRVHEVCVDMGRPQLSAAAIPTTLAGDPQQGDRVVQVPLQVAGRTVEVTCVSMGNPHCVVFVDQFDTPFATHSATDELVRELGPKIETDPRFPARTNVEFVVVLSAGEVNQRTWERGSGETNSCGTGASAVCVAGVLTGRTNRTVACQLVGGTLQLEWDDRTGHIFMTGPAVEVFSGEIALAGLESFVS